MSILRMYGSLTSTMILNWERSCSISQLISDHDPAVVMSSTYRTIIILWPALLETWGWQGRYMESISVRALGSYSNQSSGACWRPSNNLSSTRIFQSRPIPGGSTILMSTPGSPFKISDSMSNWSVSRLRCIASAIMRPRHSYCVTAILVIV